MITPQRPYKVMRHDNRRKLARRHAASGTLDLTQTHEQMRRPFGAVPRNEKGWQ